MNRKKILIAVSSTAVATAMLAATSVAHAFNMGNMFDPGDWFDNDDDDYYRHGRYYGRGYGPYGGYGGYGPYGYGGYGGYSPYGGYGGYPGYGQPSTIVVNPGGDSKAPPPPRLPE